MAHLYRQEQTKWIRLFPFQDNDNTSQVITLLHEACTRTLTIPEQQVNWFKPDNHHPFTRILLYRWYKKHLQAHWPRLWWIHVNWNPSNCQNYSTIIISWLSRWFKHSWSKPMAKSTFLLSLSLWVVLYLSLTSLGISKRLPQCRFPAIALKSCISLHSGAMLMMISFCIFTYPILFDPLKWCPKDHARIPMFEW